MDDQESDLPLSVLRTRPSRGHESASLYVPPPMRLRSVEPMSKDPPPELTNKSTSRKENLPSKPTIRSLILKELCSPSSTLPKKCENSYMLFDSDGPKLSPMNNSLAVQKVLSGKVSKCEQNGTETTNEGSRKRVVKKCDNSYLLFSDKLHDEESCSVTNGKKLLKSSKGTRLRVQKAASTNHLPSLCQAEKDEIQIKELRKKPPVMDDISLQLGAFKVANQSLIFSQRKNSSENVNIQECINRPITISSQKKCDNSSLLFDEQQSLPKPEVKHPTKSNLKHDELLRYIPLTNGNSSENKDDKLSTTNRKRPPTDLKDGSLTDISKDNPKMCNIEDKSVITKTAESSSLPAGPDTFESIEDYVVEFYDFPVTFKTQDFMSLFSFYVQDGFYVKWVDDTHALGVFSNPFSVTDVLKRTYPLLKVRVLQEALEKSQEVASTIPIPNACRPRTCPSLARRLVSGALGLRVAIPDSVRQAEKKMLQDAKAERKLAAKQREEAWEGTLKSTLGSIE